ncbi:MAG TPA: hypothetical protein RMG48_07580 [Myxococcales bacterium LLY-WYZ-16_1]|nr:hypothetical protein [Myxococcales bacterium LLY-WYZ-16_1]
MARKRSGGRGRRARAYRAPEFRVTCKGCGKVQKMPERPLPGVEMYCLDCYSAKAENR